MITSAKAPVLETKGICKAFKTDNPILKNISLTLFEGELVSLLGVSGSGKSTLFNIISGLLKADSGKVMLSGEDITGQAGKVSYMLQKDLLLPYYTVLDNVALALIIKKGESKKAAREEAQKLFALFGLEGTEKLYPAQLSGGMRQRAALLRTYLTAEGVALLDEPFSALDTITKTNIHAWYLDIMRQIKLSTLFVTHDIDEAILLSDRIYILSSHPGELTHEFVIEHPGGKSGEFALSGQFLQYKRNIINALDETDKGE